MAKKKKPSGKKSGFRAAREKAASSGLPEEMTPFEDAVEFEEEEVAEQERIPEFEALGEEIELISSDDEEELLQDRAVEEPAPSGSRRTRKLSRRERRRLIREQAGATGDERIAEEVEEFQILEDGHAVIPTVDDEEEDAQAVGGEEPPVPTDEQPDDCEIRTGEDTAPEGTGPDDAEDEGPEDAPPAQTVEAVDEGAPEDDLETEEVKYRKGFFRSRKLLSMPFSRAASRRAIDPEFWEDASEAFIAADTGVPCAMEIVDRARKRIRKEATGEDLDELKGIFREEVVSILESYGTHTGLPEGKPQVIFIVGVNGVGKTTTSAKIGWQLLRQGKTVLFAAADTFRAAGIEQMEMWAKRIGAPCVGHKTGGDPAAVVFDSIESAQAKGIDYVIVDTAGRLHTKKNLMDELNKMWRVAERQLESPPTAILAIDATTGQNGVTQARIFGEALDIGSIALTKMDGSAKGGVVLAIGKELGIPVSFIGVGEGMADLRPFDPEEYARALF